MRPRLAALLLTAAACAAIVTACISDSSKPGVASIRVVDMTGAAISGARVVSTRGDEILTDSVSDSSGNAALLVYDGSTVTAYGSDRAGRLLATTVAPVSRNDRFRLLLIGYGDDYPDYSVIASSSAAPTIAISSTASAPRTTTFGAMSIGHEAPCTRTMMVGSSLSTSLPLPARCIRDNGTMTILALSDPDRFGGAFDVAVDSTTIAVALQPSSMSPFTARATGLSATPGSRLSILHGGASFWPIQIPVVGTDSNGAHTATYFAPTDPRVSIGFYFSWGESFSDYSVAAFATTSRDVTIDAASWSNLHAGFVSAVRGPLLHGPHVVWSNDVEVEARIAILQILQSLPTGERRLWSAVIPGGSGPGPLSFSFPIVPLDLAAYAAIGTGDRVTLEYADTNRAVAHTDYGAMFLDPVAPGAFTRFSVRATANVSAPPDLPLTP